VGAWKPPSRHRFGIVRIALWDARTRTLVLARDRSALKALYYSASPGRRVALFASQIKAFRAAPCWHVPPP